ncbi:MAG: ABC transporter ATP-binding protein [Alphaproteobacteria bacterium]|nr:ABC transporter ATP-binding protein [Alphaproteobacteria bacterium]
MPPLIEARALRIEFGGGLGGGPRRRALDGVSLAVPEDVATTTALVGESGSGKTTLARALLGLVAPRAGDVAYRGVDLGAMTRDRKRAYRREVQAIFQDPFDVYNPFYRVDRALQAPLRAFGLAGSRDEAAARIEAALETVGLRPGETLGRYPHQLSGGQRQRVMIARALLLAPRLILADEPVSMVDASLRATILETLHRLKTDRGIALVYVTHDLATAYQIADRVVVLYAGRIVEAGPAEAVIKAPRHPYTSALIAAIPEPDPLKPWGIEAASAAPSTAIATGTGGCAYAARCPYAMPQCRAAVPALTTGTDHSVACFRHDEAAR